MFRWRSPFRFSIRLLQTHRVKTEPLLNQLKRCTTEYQVFQLLGMNRSALTVHDVGYAMNLLWYFQERKPEKCRTFSQIRDHPEFVGLCTSAQNKVNLLDDKELMDVLYTLMMFQLEPHNLLVQQLVVEGWRRLERLDLPTLAKFTVCLKKQDLSTSPLVGQIANIVDKNLDDTDDPTTLSCLLLYLQAVSTPGLQERIINKIESVIQNFDLSVIHYALMVFKLFYKYKFTYVFMMEKYDKFYKQNLGTMDAKNLCKILGVYHNLGLNFSDFPLLAKPRLFEIMKTCNDAETFADIVNSLSTEVSDDVRERLEEKLLFFIDEMELIQLLIVLKSMAEMKCNNDALIEKIFSLSEKHLDICKPKELFRITEALVQLSPQNTTLLHKLERHLQRKIIANFVPSEVATLAKALSLLKLNTVDEAVIHKIDSIIQQCNLSSMDNIAFLLMQLLKTPHAFGNLHKTCKELLQKLNHCAVDRLQHVEKIDHVLDEFIKIKSRQWINEELAEGLFDTCKRLLHEVNWRNITTFSLFLVQMNGALVPLLDKVATVTMEDITKIHPSRITLILSPICFLNYEPPQGRKFFDTCLQHVLEHKDLLSPVDILGITYKFALVEYFPKELINAVFNIGFLRQLDAQLKSFPHDKIKYVRHDLMQLNRAVCIEHPEYQVPWFHEPYFQQLNKKDIIPISMLLQHLFWEIFGGEHYTKVLVTTPYSYSIDLEFTLDKYKKPISYQKQDRASDNATKMCEIDIQLPEGAQRFAVVLLSAKAFCQGTHLKGRFAMKKRHLQILGYHVIQIPNYEWKSLTDRGSQILYLRNRIYSD